MSKKLWCISVMLLIGCFCMTPEAEAIFASGSIQISPQIEGNPNPIFCDPLDLPSANVIKTGDIVKFTVAITNESAVTIGGTKLPAVLANSILEIDACSINANCDGSRLPDTFDFIKCDIVDSGVASCVDDGNGGVTITMKPVDNSGCPPTGGVALAAGQQKILVVISKLAVSSIATLDPCGQFFASAATAPVDLIAYQCPSKVLGGAQGSTTLFYPSTPCIEVTKRCDPESGCYPGDIEISGEIKNCGDETLINVKATDSEAGAITDIAWPGTPGVLEVGQTASYKAKYPGALGKNPDTVTVTGSPISGKPDVTDDANAECELIAGKPSVDIDKICIDAPTGNDPIKYELTVTNTSSSDCPVTLICKLSEDSNCNIVWDPPLPVGGFELAPGATKTFEGLYSVTPCTDTQITCNNVAEVVCEDMFETVVSDKDEASCKIPPCKEEICRTPGFWGTHAGDTEKAPRSQNITQAVINKGGPLEICGKNIDNTKLDWCDSALEAICVSVKGEQKLQLARQLTAAALNCIMSNGNADCSGVSIDQLFADCNNVCQGIPVAGLDMSKCISSIDCFNNGGVYNPDLMEMCQTGTCSNNGKPCNEKDLSQCGVANPFVAWLQSISCIPLDGNCHDRELCNEDVGLCFEPPGPAGSSKDCNAAIKNGCTVFDGCSDCP